MKEDTKGTLRIIAGLVVFVLMLSWGGFAIYKKLTFKRDTKSFVYQCQTIYKDMLSHKKTFDDAISVKRTPKELLTFNDQLMRVADSNACKLNRMVEPDDMATLKVNLMNFINTYSGLCRNEYPFIIDAMQREKITVEHANAVRDAVSRSKGVEVKTNNDFFNEFKKVAMANGVQLLP